MKFLEVVKNEKTPLYMAMGLTALTIANEMWNLVGINGFVSILCIGVFVMRKFLK